MIGKVHGCVLCLACGCVLMSSGPVAGNESIVLISPASVMSYAEGDDFATIVVGKPWDMSELRDIPYDINYEQPSVSDGVWSAVSHPYTGGGVGYYYLLFRGYGSTNPLYRDYYSYYDAGMPYGPLNPVDASRYTRLSIRQSMDASRNRSFMTVSWLKTLNENEANGVMFVDADRAPSAYVPYPDGFRIYDIDLTGRSYMTDRLPGIIDPLYRGGTWDSTVYGMYVLPSTAGPDGMVNKIDWVRLYNPASSPVLPIRWTTPGVSPADETYSVQLFLDRDAQGYDGDVFMTGIRNAGRYDLYTAALPPGDYYIYLRLVHTEATSFSTVATSEYSPKIGIQSAPTFQFTSPSFTTGADYATTELANPWDMTSRDDVIASGHITGLTFSGGLLCATANPPVPPATESDCYIFLNTMRHGEFVPIDTTRYRYLTFRMMVDPTGYTNILDRIQRGWLTRYQWAKTYFEVDGSYSMSVYLLEGWHSYTVDLWDNDFLDPDPTLVVPQAGWLNIRQVNLFRMDPLEVYDYTVFYIDDVKLCAYNAPDNNAFTIGWQAGDADGDALTLTLYYGYNDANGVFQEAPEPIAVVSNAQTVHSCLWNTSGVPPGEYYIRAVVSDGMHSLSRLSMVPVIIRGGLIPVSADFDGDQKSDYAFYDQSSGEWTITLSADRSVNPVLFGGIGYTPLAADFDGDRKADPAIYETTSGRWEVMLSGSGYARATTTLGGAGYTPLAADFDGDGQADLGVYNAVTATWKDMRSASGYALTESFLGGSGYVPLAGDFNGDGRIDPAVYHSATGRWQVMWQVMLGGGGPAKVSSASGARDALPISGDYDGDGKVDLCVYRQSSGHWQVLLSGSGYTSASTILGGEGYQAVAGDFDGDGKTDPAVFSESTGRWTLMLSGSDYAVSSGP